MISRNVREYKVGGCQTYISQFPHPPPPALPAPLPSPPLRRPPTPAPGGGRGRDKYFMFRGPRGGKNPPREASISDKSQERFWKYYITVRGPKKSTKKNINAYGAFYYGSDKGLIGVGGFPWCCVVAEDACYYFLGIVFHFPVALVQTDRAFPRNLELEFYYFPTFLFLYFDSLCRRFVICALCVRACV